MYAVDPFRLNAWPTRPVAKPAPPISVPPFPAAASLASPFPLHQPASPGPFSTHAQLATPSSIEPLQLLSIPLQTVSVAPGWIEGSVSSQSSLLKTPHAEGSA